ncbi:MAG: hypothetical protein IKU42_07000 [Oscillospiraceae bacterium]|nr:hypothetical protein [Oscillospiraceae bacterium]
MIEYIKYNNYQNNKTSFQPLLWLNYKDFKKVSLYLKILKVNSINKQAIKLYLSNDFVGKVFVDGELIKFPKKNWRQFSILPGEEVPSKDETVVNFEIEKGFVTMRNAYSKFDDPNFYRVEGTLFAIEQIGNNEYLLHGEEPNANGFFDSITLYFRVVLEE